MALENVVANARVVSFPCTRFVPAVVPGGGGLLRARSTPLDGHAAATEHRLHAFATILSAFAVTFTLVRFFRFGFLLNTRAKRSVPLSSPRVFVDGE
jgi:hypothetical protein